MAEKQQLSSLEVQHKFFDKLVGNRIGKADMILFRQRHGIPTKDGFSSKDELKRALSDRVIKKLTSKDYLDAKAQEMLDENKNSHHGLLTEQEAKQLVEEEIEEEKNNFLTAAESNPESCLGHDTFPELSRIVSFYLLPVNFDRTIQLAYIYGENGKQYIESEPPVILTSKLDYNKDFLQFRRWQNGYIPVAVDPNIQAVLYDMAHPILFQVSAQCSYEEFRDFFGSVWVEQVKKLQEEANKSSQLPSLDIEKRICYRIFFEKFVENKGTFDKDKGIAALKQLYSDAYGLSLGNDVNGAWARYYKYFVADITERNISYEKYNLSLTALDDTGND